MIFYFHDLHRQARVTLCPSLWQVKFNLNASYGLNLSSMLRSEFLFPFSVVVVSDRSSRPNRMCLCCHKQMSIASDPDHIFLCMRSMEGLCICAKSFARRFRPRVATQTGHPGNRNRINCHFDQWQGQSTVFYVSAKNEFLGGKKTQEFRRAATLL